MMHTFIPQSVDALVDQQIRKWNAQRQRAASPPAPVITVSRQFGAGGAEVASLVATHLGFDLWNGAVLGALAQHARTPAQLFGPLDEHRRSALTELIAVFGAGRHVTASDYLRELTSLVRTVAARGAAVFVGRGAQYIVDPREALRVRVVGSFDSRLARVVGRTGASLTDARLEILSIDADRADFVREHYGRDVDEPVAYDLVVNTATVTPAMAAALVARAYRARFATDARAFLPSDRL